ncbi:hypothetical protein B296_00036546, partial [Ensete ventricosum]
DGARFLKGLAMAGEDLIDVKFRLFDGTDIGPSKYDPTTTVASLKETILARWPQGERVFPSRLIPSVVHIDEFSNLLPLLIVSGNFDLVLGKEIAPRTINDVKLINAGKILENNQTIAESRTPVCELPGGVITMHVVVRPPMLDKNNGIFM